MEGKRSVWSVLAEVQHRVSCPKGKFNKFGGYAYRSLEDINGALKPICEELRCGYVFEDGVQPMETAGGEPRWYLRATVTFWADGCEGTVSSTAYAREPLVKKGMDEAQITGLASSYARKYAACGLFAIDSGEDPDQMDNTGRSEGRGRSGGNSSTGKAKTPPQNGSQRPAGGDMSELVGLANEFGKMCGKDAVDVIRAVAATRTMQDMGAGDGSRLTADQIGTAAAIVRGWIDKKREA